MGNFVFNIAKGRVVELYNRVDLGDPSTSRLVLILLASSGIESDATLIDKDTFADVVSGATNEATNTGYARKTLAGSDLSAAAPTDASDLIDLDFPDQTFAAVANDGTGAIGAAVVCYDAVTGSGTDADLVPLTKHDFAVTPDGTDIVLQTPNNFFRAS